MSTDGLGIGLPLEQLFVHGHTTPTDTRRNVHLTLHGIGVIVVSAASERVVVHTRRGDVMVGQEFARGVAISELTHEDGPFELGTRTQFWHDPKSSETSWDPTTIDRRLRVLVASRSHSRTRQLDLLELAEYRSTLELAAQVTRKSRRSIR